MDITHEIDPKPVPFSAVEIGKAQNIILTAIRINADCYWPDIVRHSKGTVSQECLLEASQQLQRAKQIRLREPAFDHQYEYVIYNK